MYKRIVKPILFRFDPEFVHVAVVKLGKWIGNTPLRTVLGVLYQYKGDDIGVTVDGIRYKTPFLLSAGFDYNGELSQILPFISFGGEEVGSVTARECFGNPKPRLTRLPHSISIIVNKGLKNDGVDVIARRLKKTKRYEGFVIGVSIARTNDARASSVESGIEDYCESFRILNEQGVGDYYTINISCPNAHGGETFAQPILLERLLNEIRKIPCEKPVYVKMPINISWENLAPLLDCVKRHSCNGVVIGNLNKDYSSLTDQSEAPESFQGGLSGLPCRDLSTNLIRMTRAYCGPEFTIIGCGGVMSPEEAEEKFEAGANLIQLITGMIYEGPGLIKTLCEDRENKLYAK